MLSNRVGNRICGLVCAGTLLAGLGNAPASAQTADERTFFTFSGPVELPGIALAPGTYMFRLISPNNDHSFVQVVSAVGNLGTEQLEWLEKDVKHLKSSTPIVVFAHIPLWSIYPEWGWGTDDSAQALSYLKRFGSVSVLNGHIHQVMQKVEGHVTFHTAMSTAFPQPAPGSAPSPGPMKVEADRLRKVLGLSRMSFHDVKYPIAITDLPLEEPTQAAANDHGLVVTGPIVAG